MWLFGFIQDKLGLARQDLAEYLELPSGSISMVTQEFQVLPLKAEEKLTSLWMLLDTQPVNFQAGFEEGQKKQADATMAKIRGRHLLLVERLKERLQDLEKQYQQCREIYWLSENLANQNGDLRWMEDQKGIAEKRLLKCGLAEQEKLRLRIRQLELTSVGNNHSTSF